MNGIRIITAKDVREKTSLSRTTLWRLARAGQFPAPVRLSVNRMGWNLCDVDAWLSERANDNHLSVPRKVA